MGRDSGVRREERRAEMAVSDLVFAGGREGYFFALDARTGELLWKGNIGGQVSAGPMSYAVNGRQHVAIAAGSALFVYALRQ
ncbi:MAG: hypothetical protein DMG00_26965 [Acidobacteria bacterium]|nr:MAG: hypothetical protein DMG00_26965 [Acidobacteriota bacterium]